MDKKIKVFLSYCHRDSVIADRIEAVLLAALDINISRDIREVRYKQSFKKYMDTISNHDFVFQILSDGYMKSEACMYELGEILKDHSHREKLIFVILSDEEGKYYEDKSSKPGVDIYKDKGKSYFRYWAKEKERLENELENTKNRGPKIMYDKDLLKINKILDYDLPDFIEYLLDAKGIFYKELERENFKTIIDEIKTKIPDIKTPIRMSSAISIGYSMSIRKNYILQALKPKNSIEYKTNLNEALRENLNITGKKVNADILAEIDWSKRAPQDGFSMVLYKDFKKDWRKHYKHNGRIEFDAYGDEKITGMTVELKKMVNGILSIVFSNEIIFSHPYTIKHHSLPLSLGKNEGEYINIEELCFTVFPYQLKSDRTSFGLMNLAVVCDED